MQITSKQNELVKKYASLKDKKFRGLFDLFLVEGEKMVREAIKSNQEIENILGTDKYQDEFSSFDRFILVTKPVIDHISEAKSPEGIIAIIKTPKTKEISSKNVIILDNISDPGNLGTIIRTAVASNFNDIILIDCVDEYNPKVIRSSKSGMFFANLVHLTYEQVLNMKEFELIVADMNGTNIFEFEKPKKAFALIIGSESHGVNKVLSDFAKHIVKIPMNEKTESLNASVSAGILMYMLTNKL